MRKERFGSGSHSAVQHDYKFPSAFRIHHSALNKKGSALASSTNAEPRPFQTEAAALNPFRPLEHASRTAWPSG
ncbi:hypothetical protein I41_20120 [Lacipirellula limnantheis]|uniref:Uncharacterized protein n=1 Tax=Lacipirellula limnantheis TaxID=2528024 RepID=A0A517TWT0_9BACT|nr:hypothetical protein I41_20120 [Lacipirellula limnantheis]